MTLNDNLYEGRWCHISHLKDVIKELTIASENNDWEVAIDDGSEDGFRIVSGIEFINKIFGKELCVKQEEGQ